MRRTKPYLFIFFVLLVVMSVPPLLSEKIRGRVMATVGPLWSKSSTARSIAMPQGFQEKLQKLELENKLLYAELVQLRELVDNADILKISSVAVPARVIFRSPNTWQSSIWINMGYKDNQPNGRPIIARNSPVLVGSSIIGVIDYAGPHQSRVRLITDSGLTPSVRVLRVENNTERYLAKGELRGASHPLWRSNGDLLKGIGFNYDFADEKGPEMDLRTGDIIRVNDLLVTTGMDGVFPPGFSVAKVTKLYPLKEGDYFYEIEALPTAGPLEDISLVFILAPTGYDPLDQPKPIGR